MVHQVEVFLLRLDIGQHHPDCGQFVAPDPPINDLLRPGPGVEVPPAIGLHDRDRQRPVVRSDIKLRVIGPILCQLMLLVIGRSEPTLLLRIGIAIAGRQQLFAVGPKDRAQRSRVVRASG